MKNNQKKGSKSGFRAANRAPEGVTYKVTNSYFGSIYGQEEKDAVLAAMDQEWLTNGPLTALFEEEFASYHDTNYAFTTSNCTAALHIASDLLNLQPEDEVITTPCTFIATSQPILCRGSKVVFADIDQKTFNIDPKAIEEKITSRTKAIFLVVFGTTTETGTISFLPAYAAAYPAFPPEAIINSFFLIQLQLQSQAQVKTCQNFR